MVSMTHPTESVSSLALLPQELTDSVSLAGQGAQTATCLDSPTLGFQKPTAAPGFYIDAGHLNSGPQPPKVAQREGPALPFPSHLTRHHFL